MKDIESGEEAASHRLPMEVVLQICRLAAESDRHCAHTLAFVSREVCRWTAEARWRVVAITTVRQFCAFYREVHAVTDKEYNLVMLEASKKDPSFRGLMLESHVGWAQISDRHITYDRWNLQRQDRRRSSISLPSGGEPHTFVKHLFLELSDDPHYCFTNDRGGPRLTTKALRDILYYDVNSEAAQYGRARFLESNEADYTRGLWYLFSGLGGGGVSLDTLTLGARAEDLISRHDSIRSVEELTIAGQRFESRDFKEFVMGTNAARSHIIGVDAASELSGCSPPWSLLLALRDNGTRYLRYDTRKFSFKPAEIFASRLRPLLQEMTVKTRRTSRNTHFSENGYQHTGAPHAAPARGAGNASRATVSSLIPIEHLGEDEFAQILREESPRLDILHFAWEPMNTGERRADDIPLHLRARFSSGESTPAVSASKKAEEIDYTGLARTDTGGWPRERRGAWTERSDRDLAPSFAVELRDAIHSLYGWHAPGIEPAGKFVARRDRLQRSALEGTQILRNVAFSPDGAGEWVERIKDGFKDVDIDELRVMQTLLEQHSLARPVPQLQYGVRAPQSLVHLGGKAPFEFKDRLALFEDRARGGFGAWNY